MSRKTARRADVNVSRWFQTAHAVHNIRVDEQVVPENLELIGKHIPNAGNHIGQMKHLVKRDYQTFDYTWVPQIRRVQPCVKVNDWPAVLTQQVFFPAPQKVVNNIDIPPQFDEFFDK